MNGRQAGRFLRMVAFIFKTFKILRCLRMVTFIFKIFKILRFLRMVTFIDCIFFLMASMAADVECQASSGENDYDRSRSKIQARSCDKV